LFEIYRYLQDILRGHDKCGQKGILSQEQRNFGQKPYSLFPIPHSLYFLAPAAMDKSLAPLLAYSEFFLGYSVAAY